MRMVFFLGMILGLIGCSEDLPFVANEKYLYSPEWKIWKKEIYFRNLSNDKITITQSRDIETRYRFTDSLVYRSTNQGELFNKLITNHLSLDSISFTDPQSGKIESYRIFEMFRMKDAFPPSDSSRLSRDQAFAELKDFLLFLHLENKNKIIAENEEITEYLLLYN